MNTLLPTGTLKSLKMIATAICLTVVFVLATNVTSAQVIDARNTTPEITGQKPVVKQEANQTNPVQTNVATGSVEIKPASVTIETAKSTSTVKPASFSSHTNSTNVQAEIKETKVEEKQQSVVVVPENQPYLNYKGISNPKEARKVWIVENPEAAQKLSEKLQQENSNKKVEPVRK
jgi:multisubunit Na+/H+ antiporter MnhE subunit